MEENLSIQDQLEVCIIIDNLDKYFKSISRRWMFSGMPLEERIIFFDHLDLRCLTLINELRELKEKYTTDKSEDDL